jgi:hypothetical protein
LQSEEDIMLIVYVESQCQGNLVKQASAREVVVWVNEHGDPIDPKTVNKDHAANVSGLG